MSQCKISRIETGRVLPSVDEVERILAALEVPGEVAREITALARRANVQYQSWRTYAQKGLWRRQAELKMLADSSRVVRQFLPAIPSGLLQTERYARAALQPSVPSDSVWDVEKAVRARTERQETLWDEERSFSFVLTEQAVRWRYASAEIMAEQCRHMAELAQRPNVDLAVIPLSAEVVAAPLHVFVIYDERLVTVEMLSGGVALREPQDISYYLDLFAKFRQSALAGSDAVHLLELVAHGFMRERD